MIKNDNKTKIEVKNLNLFYGTNQALFDITANLYENKITALIGPSGCGKSTFLRCINRMNDLIPIVKIDGKIIIDNKNIYDKDVDEVSVRKKIGMVFQQPNPFPKSIYDNVAYAPLKHGIVKKGKDCDELVELSLIKSGLWNEVKDKLNQPGTSLSGGQQQRVAVARALANQPSLILADEPTAALDSHRGRQVMELFAQVAHESGTGVIVVTHDTRALEVFDRIVEMEDGRLRPTSAEHLGKNHV